MDKNSTIPAPETQKSAPKRAVKLALRVGNAIAGASRKLVRVWKAFSLKTADEWLSALFGILLRGAGLCLLAFALLVTWRIINAKGYVIAPFTVPEALVKNGYSGQVLAFHLQDAIKKVKESAQSVKADDLVLQDGGQEAMDVSVMGVQVSVKSIAYHLGQLLGRRQRQISAELTQSQDKLRFTVRFTDFPTVRLEQAIEDGDLASAVDGLLRQAALKLLEYNDPYRLAVILYTEKKYDEALQVIRKIIAERPHERDWAYIAWGSVLQQQKQMDAAADKFKLAIQQDSTNWLPYYRLSTLAFLRSDFEEAGNWLEQVVRLNPDHLNAHITLGWRYVHAGLSAKADSSFQNAVRSSKVPEERAAAWQSWIESKLNNGDEKEALRIIDMAMASAEENADGYLLRGIGYVIRKDTLAAYSAFERAFQLDPTNFRAVMAFANINYKMRRYEQTVAIEEACFDASMMHEGGANLLNLGALACNQMGRHEQALNKVRRAIEIAPHLPAPYTTLAETHAFMGQSDAFFTHLETGLAKGFPAKHLDWTEEPYRRYRSHPKSAALMAKFGVYWG